MTGPIGVTPDVLHDTANLLRRGADTAESLTSDAPGLPDAGDFSGDAGAVVAHLLDAAAQIAIGLAAAGDAVGTAADTYRTTDQAARDQLTPLWTN